MMLSYDDKDTSMIVSCSFHDVDTKSIDTNELFKEGSKWINRDLLFNTIQIYTSSLGWSPMLYTPVYIRCSCFQRPASKKQELQKFSSGTLDKGYNWEIRIKSTKNIAKKITKGKNFGRFKSVPCLDIDSPVIITKSSCNHTGDCQLSILQQVLQRSRSGLYVRSLNEASIHTLCTMLKNNGQISSSVIKMVIQSQFPANKSITKQNIFHLKNKLNKILPLLNGCGKFDQFLLKFCSSRMHIGIDNDPLNDDDICSMGKQTLEEIMNDESTENPFFTFHEYMSTMAKLNKGFAFQFLQDTTGRYTGCIWMTATMRSDFERFGSYICLDAMQKTINTLA